MAPFRQPERQTGSDQIAHGEKAEFFSDAAMVAALGFFELVQIFVQLFLIDETCAVNPLHLRIAFLALPVRAGDAHQFEGLDASGGRNVRAAAEINEFSGGVERNHRLGGFFFHQLAFKFLIAFAIELEGFGLGDQLALVRKIFRGESRAFWLRFFRGRPE